MLIRIKNKDSFLIYLSNFGPLKFIYCEKATKFCEISTVDLSYVVPVKSTVEISQNFVAFSEYMNFKNPYSSDKIVYCVAVVVRKHGGNFTIKAHFGVVNSTSHGPIKSEAKYEP